MSLIKLSKRSYLGWWAGYFVIMLSFSSCAIVQPVVYLVTEVLKLPFKIIQTVMQMIPTLAKYAPLALLFISNESDAEGLDIVSITNLQDLEGKDLKGYLIDVSELKDSEEKLLSVIKNGGQIFFLACADNLDEEVQQKIYDEMKEMKAEVAFDDRLFEGKEEIQNSYV